METQMKKAMKDAGLKPKRTRGILKAAADFLATQNCSQMHPCTVRAIANSLGYTESQISSALSNAFVKNSVRGLRRTASAMPGSRYDYWIETEDSTEPQNLEEALQLLGRAQAMIADGTKLLATARHAVEKHAKLPDDVRVALKGLL